MFRSSNSAAAWLAAALLALGEGLPPCHASADAPKQVTSTTVLRGVVKAVNAARRTLIVQGGKEPRWEKSLALAKDVRVLFDGGTGEKVDARKGAAGELTEGTAVDLTLSAREVVAVWVEGASVKGTLTKADAKGALTVSVAGKKGEEAEERSFTLSRGARVEIDQPKAKTAKAAKLADLPAGVVVTLRLSADGKAVGMVRAFGATVEGEVQAVDAAKNAVTLRTKGGARRLAVERGAEVFVEDGKGEKTSPKARKLAALPTGAVARARLSLDGKTVIRIWAEGATLRGSLRGVNASKGTITVQAKGQKEQTLAVGKGAAIPTDGTKGQLATLPKDAQVLLKLSPDGKTVVAVHVEAPVVRGRVKGEPGTGSITVAGKGDDQTYDVGEGVKIIASGRAAKLAELIEGTVVSLRLSADRTKVLGTIYAEGPSHRGIIKGVDKDKDTVIVTVGGKKGVGGEDMTLQMTKNTAVVTEQVGVALRRADLRAEREVIVRLTIDQKSVARVIVLGE